MDIVPDMDDLLNELEAAETSGKLTYDTNDPLVKTKMVLSDSSYDFIDECNSILILRKDHIGMLIFHYCWNILMYIGKFYSTIRAPEMNNIKTWRNASYYMVNCDELLNLWLMF